MKGALKIAKDSLITSGLSIGLGAFNNTPAMRGQQALSNYSSFYPVIGSLEGSKMVIESTKKLLPKKRIRL